MHGIRKPPIGADIIYDLGPKIGIGIGFGYIHTLGNDTFRHSELKVYQNIMNSATNLNIVTFRLGPSIICLSAVSSIFVSMQGPPFSLRILSTAGMHKA
jgi:hypothetical protein